jgi:transcription-repair coupling factor (superfamily II helicase)
VAGVNCFPIGRQEEKDDRGRKKAASSKPQIFAGNGSNAYSMYSMIEDIKKQIAQSDPFQRIVEAAGLLQSGAQVRMEGLSGSLTAFVAVCLFETLRKQIVLAVPEKDRAVQLHDDCATLMGHRDAYLYAAGPSRDSVQLDMSAPIAQVETLRALSQRERVLVVASAEALSGEIPAPETFSRRRIDLAVDAEHAFEELIKTLAALGFEKKDFVEEYGDYAVRGGILDVFPYIGENPLRFEFWGDRIESIREFDALSQRSIRELQAATIVADLHPGALRKMQPSESPTGRENSVSVFDYLQRDALIVFDEPALIAKEIDELVEEGYKDIFDWAAIDRRAGRFPQLVHSSLTPSTAGSIIRFGSSPQPPFGGSVKRLLEEIRKLSGNDYAVYLACDTSQEEERLTELIEEELTAPERFSEADDKSGGGSFPNSSGTSSSDSAPIAPISYRIFMEALHSGFIYPPARIAVLTEHELFGRIKRRASSRRRKFKGISQKELQQLRRGDFVVHQDYGIGRFAGLQKITLQGTETEVMKLLYEGNDTLYVNLNFINRVQKYSSQEGHVPKLSKLGAPDWDRLKLRARKKIKDIARDLITIYARRKHEPGFAFESDTHWQKEMEASFLYEDTPDQAKASMEVKMDMEGAAPMDRLICGDVGFGKTEVAVRAAFKAVMNGKQVALLVPTTILAQQHYLTFLDRVGRYSVRVESLTRFRAKKDQASVLGELREGRVDILIGTHRLLSKDVEFKNLGLLIIDEEHRFGVSAKEKLRRLRATVDTLTLTATPIPRTLQFSLMGARDLSLIATPPRNRLPIQTEIAQFDPQLIREAIMKELHRGGQVYFVHDRVQNIDTVQSMLKSTVPRARIHVAHGQMKGHELEKAMTNFLEKKFDVLVCTKIIESGIDIPSVNTIIINRADRFGMAELYQLRGRVGRSNIQAYAYLLTPPLSVLPRQTLRRLQAIQEFTELGSGFNLAMRDLEIRGAGNLLGGEQSGFILEMGFEMYQRVVEEAVRELKEEEFGELIRPATGESGKTKTETIIESDIEALIPEVYIESDSERLDVYRRLYRSGTPVDIGQMRAELRDRFGEYPEEVDNLFNLVELKVSAASVGFVKLELHRETLTLSFPPSDEKVFYEGDGSPFQRVMKHVRELKDFRCRLRQEGKQLKLIATIPGSQLPKDRLEAAGSILESLQKAVSLP